MDFFYPPELPISSYRNNISRLLKDNQVVVVAGDTGSGKTTQLPKICLETFPTLSGMIGCTQPRRVAATSVSERVREELGPHAPLVGYKIRFHDNTTADTRIKFMTDGILLAETKQDPLLKKYDIIIIDEAHERSLNIDFLIGYLRRIIVRRPELKLIITSATIDTAIFSGHFNNAPILQIEGRTFPVKLVYSSESEKDDEVSYLERCVDTVSEVCEHYPPGDILVFLPTERDIRECMEILQGRTPHHLILPMFGRLQTADQQRVFKNYQKSKIVIATNVAETSVTVPGIRYVVDTGLARISSYNQRSRTTSLPVTRISRASCNQRAGRCGRTGPGTCFRLYSEEEYLSRPEYTTPEIQRSNLAEVILQMIALDLGDPYEFPFLEPPHRAAVREGYRMLRELGAVNDSQRLTKTGKVMTRLPIDPVISRIIIEAQSHNCLTEIAIIASALAIQDPRVRPADKEALADQAHETFAHPHSDFMVLLIIWNKLFQAAQKFSWSRLKRFCVEHFLSFQRMREWIDLHEQLVHILQRHDGFHFNNEEASYESLHRSLLSGFFRQCARRKTKTIYQGTSQRDLMIFPGSHQFSRSGEWIIAGSFIETSRLFAMTVATIEPEWLEDSAGEFCTYSWTNVRWQKKKGQVVADETVSLNGLVILSGRTVNFAKKSEKNRPEARAIFLQKALVENQLNRNYPFLSHNSNLIKIWQEAEHKLRKRDIIIEDATIYNFYDRRLPADVYDQSTLQRFLKKSGKTALFMTEQDILLRKPDDRELADFPPSLVLGSIEIPLSYCFNPGDPKDGVSAVIPAHLVDSLKHELFDWLVPGLLQEKTVFLIKGLPKKIRKNLIPVNQTVDRLLDSMVMYRGNYLQELSAVIFKMFRVTIHPNDWPQPLPDHLRMRFIVVDHSGKECASGRDLNILQAGSIPETPDKAEQYLKENDRKIIARYEKEIVTAGDYHDVPRRIPQYSHDDRIIGYLFAALQPCPEKQGLRILYLKSAPEAARISRMGTRYLLQLAFSEQFKRLKKYCRVAFSGPSTIWLCSLIGGSSKASDSMLAAAVNSFLEDTSETIISQKSFTELIARIQKKGFFNSGRLVVDQIMGLLHQRKEIHDTIAKFQLLSEQTGEKNASLYEDLRAVLDDILPADFLNSYQAEQFENLSRYLKSLAVRTERAYANPLKDRQKQRQIAPHLENIDAFRKKGSIPLPECEELFREYCQMVMELRVSLFSPEIKTSVKVSEKKLRELWKQLASLC